MFRRIFGLSVAVILMLGFVVPEAQAKKKGLVLRIVADPVNTFDSAPGVLHGGQAFYITGDICQNTTGVGACSVIIGEFHCWGWIPGTGPAGRVTQEFVIFNVGKILLQGAEDLGPRAIIGGTGRFRNARGEAVESDLLPVGAPDGMTDRPEFTITFNLIGAKKK